MYKLTKQLDLMWAALGEYQEQASSEGHGESWARMCKERTSDSISVAYQDSCSSTSPDFNKAIFYTQVAIANATDFNKTIFYTDVAITSANNTIKYIKIAQEKGVKF
jgi:hypothetical protein